MNTHRYLLKSDDFLTSLYNDRTINLPDTLEDAKDPKDGKKDKEKSESQQNSNKKGNPQKK